MENLIGQKTDLILVVTNNGYTNNKYCNVEKIGIDYVYNYSDSRYYAVESLDYYSIYMDCVTQKYWFECDLIYGYYHNSEGCVSEGYYRLTSYTLSHNNNYYYNSMCLNRCGLSVCSNCGNIANWNSHCRCRRRDYCFNYHSMTRLNKGGRARFRLGIEIEKEDSEMLMKEKAIELLDSTLWIKETDSSLNSNGFELISPILNFKNVYKYIDKIRDYISAEYSENCGGHIHVSDRLRNPLQIFDDVAGYFPLLYAMYPKRIQRDYSCAFKKDVYKNSQGSHCQSININNRTLEFRIFPSPKNYDVLDFRIKLLKLMLVNKRDDVKLVQRDLLNTNSKLFKLLTTRYNLTSYIKLYNRFMRYTSSIEGIELSQKNLKNIEKRLREIEIKKSLSINESEES